MDSFEELGLREPLLRALEDLGVERPTSLQEAVIPVLRREGNIVARAGSGSGKTLAWALGVLDRIEPREDGEDGEAEEEGGEPAPGGTRVLVLVPTPEAAERTALTLVPLAQASGLDVTTTGPGWRNHPDGAGVLVATPSAAVAGVRTSGVKLESLEAVVVDGASEIETLGEWEALETLFDHVPRDAQRVVFTAATTDGVSDLVDRRVKRALRYPSQPADPASVPKAAPTGVIGYVLVPDAKKLDVVARVLGARAAGEGAPVLACRTDERAAEVAEALAMRGFLVGEPDDDETDVAVVASGVTLEELKEETGETPSMVISYDVPGDERVLRARHAGDVPGFVLVEPRELPHLRDIADRAGLRAQAAGVSGEEPAAATALRGFRDELRRAIAEEDLGAQMLVLEPLFDDFTPAEVAAAAAALLRKKSPASAPPSAGAPATATAQPAQAAGAGRAAPEPRSAKADPGPQVGAYVRLFVGVGERDGVRAGDLVGAIAGEANIPGSQVGRIDIRDTFSVVEVAADVADAVIRAVNGITIKGRSVRVDYDRGGDRSRRPGGPGGAGGPGGRPRPGGPGGGPGARGGGRGPGGPSRGPGGPGGPRPPVRRPRPE